MSTGIGVGDLVMVVKPTRCCGKTRAYGRTFTVKSIEDDYSYCALCGSVGRSVMAIDGNEIGYNLDRLKKIDPPAKGDSLPTRADINDRVPT